MQAADFAFDLESSERFPTQSSKASRVRVYVLVYSLAEFALPGYSVRVWHDGILLPSYALSTGGLPEQTRPEPSSYTRLTNLQVEFIQRPGGIWEVQLVNAAGTPVGPPATFTLAESDPNRELYARYRKK
jgi:hypothetical protein